MSSRSALVFPKANESQKKSKGIKETKEIFTKNIPSGFATSRSQVLLPKLIQNPDLQNVAKIKELTEIFSLDVKEMLNSCSLVDEIREPLSSLYLLFTNKSSAFYKQIDQYYLNFYTLKESINSNQIISAAQCHPSLRAFKKIWIKISNFIDGNSNMAPLPHDRVINSKFNSIVSSLNIVQKSNERRKHQNKSITQSVLSLQSLITSISAAISNMFTNNNFFSHNDMFQTYRKDIKSLLNVINQAFSNDFILCGHVSDINMIRSNIFSECHDIISLLKSAFAFPLQIKALVEKKDEINNLVVPIFQRIDVPFVIIKPDIPTKGENDSDQKPKNNETVIINRPRLSSPPVARKEDELQRLQNTVIRFLDTNIGLLCPKAKCFSEISDNLSLLQDAIHDLHSKNKILIDERDALRKELRVLKETIEENQMIYREKSSLIASQIEEKDQKIRSVQKSNDELTIRCSNLVEIVKEQNSFIMKYDTSRESDKLREDIIGIIGQFDSKPAIDCDDKTLLDHLLSIINRPHVCKECQEKEIIIESAKGKLKNVLKEKGEEISLMDLVTKTDSSYSIALSKSKEAFTDYNRLQSKIFEISKQCLKNEEISDDIYIQLENIQKRLSKRIPGSLSSTKLTVMRDRSFCNALTGLAKKISAILNEDTSYRLRYCLSSDISEQFFQTMEAIENQLHDIVNIFSSKDSEISSLNVSLNHEKEEFLSFKNELINTFNLESNDDLLSNLIDSIENQKEPYIMQVQAITEEKEKIFSYLLSILTRVRGIIRGRLQVSLTNPNTVFEEIHKILDDIQDTNDTSLKKLSQLDSTRLSFRKILIDVLYDWTEYNHQNRQIEELAKLTDQELLNSIVSASNQIISQKNNSQNITV